MNARQGNKIKGWLKEHRISIISIARALKKSNSVIHETISGAKNNRAVLEYLRKKGVPECFLALPEDMQQREAA